MSKSAELFNKARRFIPGGVNSPVRAFTGVGGTPVFFERGTGPYLFDCDGKRYIDYVGSWGPLILGHAHPAVLAAVQTAIAKGLSFGAPTELEVLLAEKICQLMPAVEKVRLVNSGTEATMSAIRLARGYTGRDYILKFSGCYHGHSDSLLAKAGSGVLTLGIPDSAGVPTAIAQYTLTADFNDQAQATEIFARYGEQLAAVIIEPIAGNMNFVMPTAGFLAHLRALCDRYGSLFIIDEVMTGFRVGLGGAQAHFKIKPDLTTLGKVIGGGMPVGAVGGRQEIMDYFAPLGPVYQAGTLSGNPVAMAAGLATLNAISQPGFYEKLSATTRQLIEGLIACANTAGIALTGNYLGGMFGFFFNTELPSSFAQVQTCHREHFQRFFHGMLKEGVYFAPSLYEAGFVSAAHGPSEITATLQAAEKIFTTIK